MARGSNFNPILNGGGEFTLSAIYCLKSPESGYKGGVKWYQNSSWDIWSTTKQFSGPKFFLGPTPGPAKLAHQKNGVSRNLEYFPLDQTSSPRIIERAQFWVTITHI